MLLHKLDYYGIWISLKIKVKGFLTEINQPINIRHRRYGKGLFEDPYNSFCI